MLFLNNQVSKYGLHDTTINKINLCSDGVLFIFDEGGYHLSDDGRELELSKRYSIKIVIESFDINHLYEHISIRCIRKKKVKELEIGKFIDMVNASKQGFMIDLDYYSDFAKSILLKGYFDKWEIELMITEIDKIEYIFDNSN